MILRQKSITETSDKLKCVGHQFALREVEDLEAIDQALKEAGNRDYKIVLLPNLNHLFQTTKTGAPSEYAEIEETIAPIALQTMGDWIVAHTGRNSNPN